VCVLVIVSGGLVQVGVLRGESGCETVAGDAEVGFDKGFGPATEGKDVLGVGWLEWMVSED
jgi:hypothetical protein